MLNTNVVLWARLLQPICILTAAYSSFTNLSLTQQYALPTTNHKHQLSLGALLLHMSSTMQQAQMRPHSQGHAHHMLPTRPLKMGIATQNGSQHCYSRRVDVRIRAAGVAHAKQQGNTIVLGSGISGLSAAKVLSKYFSDVRVIDKDAVQSLSAEERATEVSKYNHMHILAGKGLIALDELFEGRFVPALQQSGAVLSDVVTAFINYHPAGGRWVLPAAPAKGPVLMGQATRHLFESVTRQLLQDTPGVQVLDSTAVTGLLLQQQGNGAAKPRVTGLRLADGSELYADLVVDCSGRQSQTPQWLAAAGLPAPRTAEVNASLGYASWLAKLDPEVAARTLQGSSGMYAVAAYPKTVGGAVVAVEDGLHMIGLCTYEGQAPPFKDDQLLGFMQKQAWHPAVAEIMAGATPMGKVSRFYRVSSTWRRYDEVDLPDGLLVTADAVCSFNPIYGHGMTVAALEVAELDELLAARQAAAGSGSEQGWLMGLSQEYQQAILPIIQRVWDLSVGGDLRFSSATSTEPPSAASGFMNAYFDSLMALAATDPEVTEAVLRVMHLIDDTAELTTPRMLGKVLRYQLTGPLLKLFQQGPQPGGSSSSSGTGSTTAGGVGA